MSPAPAPTRAVPFHVPHTAERQDDYLRQVLASGDLDGNGPYSARATEILARITGSPHVLLTPSCTHALEIAALLLELAPGDEVVMPSFTFAPTASAVAMRGAVPVFVDCHPDTLNMDESLLEAALTERTRAIVAVHYAGVACEMREIQRIADAYGVPVIEDNAHGLGATYQGRPLGGFGTLSAQSFHATKNVHCGKGGALLVNDPELVERATIIRDRGTDRHQYFLGQVDKYRWVDLGSSYILPEVLAALLAAQLEEFDAVQKRRHALWDTYHSGLAGWAADERVALPTVPADREHSAHLYHLVLPSEEDRTALLQHLAERDVRASVHFLPLHTSPAGLRYGRSAPGGCPVSERIADRLVRLPLHTELSDAQAGRVVEALASFRTGTTDGAERATDREDRS
ncbi:dTDP-4-amino-4,6-dideoxygalactose transaminase [Streptomyces sp. SID4919]|uniref:dTDP-4-amino-4,6-dideoxygalactose transaminase n=1 Tax=unclassified Streptomyces TaxID=2593676 RepID=UPI00082383B5|nr:MULTISPECIES: dTDP-4-amino-4,6-dideoxygalactose transaminase [unclassified Streptomyces]MYY08200.1 dTDP-4-amino-4,6-dideoxygalactose transaminase [Streptomyces sp. SID4919]SCK09984.1 dTDP-4-amino-4,6-dideoxygalactose transaminase [Streptomyces sp. AmelKG-E11A]